MSSVITISSDEEDDFKDKDSKVKPTLSINSRLHPSITITKVSPKESKKKEKDKIEVKSLSKPFQNRLDFNNIKRKYSFDPKNNANKNEKVPNAFERLCKRSKSQGTPEVVDIDLENDKPGSQSNGFTPKIIEVKSVAKDKTKKNISELICDLAGVPMGATATTQINPQKTNTLEKDLEKSKDSASVLNPFSSAVRKSPPPLQSIRKKPKSVHKSLTNKIRAISCDSQQTNNLSSLNTFQPKTNSDKNFNILSEYDMNVKKNDEVEIVSLEGDEKEEKKEEKKAVGEDQVKSGKEKHKRKRDESHEQEDKVKKKKENSDPEEKQKRPKSSVNVPETYEKFIMLIKTAENNIKDREKILKKFTKYFNSSDPSYVHSEEFNSLLEKSIEQLKEEPLKLYFVLKEVFENLQSRKEVKLAKKRVSLLTLEEDKKEILKEHLEPEEFMPKPEISKKNEKKVEKLEKTMEKLQRKVKKLEEAEVDLDDEQNSNYFRMQKYRERLYQVWKKYCELTKGSPDAGRTDKTRIGFSGTKIPSVNKCIEKWLNKTRQFPDFVDIFNLIRQQNETEDLGMTPDQIKTVAETAFREVGEALRRRRQYDLYDIHSSYFDEVKDPAESDAELNAQLENNKKEYSKKLEDIMNLYVEKQGNAKGEEVPDDEAERSVESDDEDEKEIEEIENNLKEASSDEENEEEKILENGDDDIQALSPSPEEMDELPSSPTNDNPQTGDGVLTTPPVKESKNNYKHCKSLKWRVENNSKVNSDLCNGNDKSVSDNKSEDNNLNSITNNEKCKDDLSAKNLKLVEDDGEDKPKTDLKKNDSSKDLVSTDLDKNDSMKDLDCEIIELSPPKNNWMKDNHIKKSTFLVNYVSVEHSFKSYENNFNKKFKYKKFREKTLNDLTNLNEFDACREKGRRNFKFFTKKSHKENLDPRVNYKFFNQDKVFKLGCLKKRDRWFNCTLEGKENEVRVNRGDNKGEEREVGGEENGSNGQENENLSGSGNGDGNNNEDDGGEERRREKNGDEENKEEEEKEAEEEEEDEEVEGKEEGDDYANGNYDAETDSESQSSKDGGKERSVEGGMEESSREKEEDEMVEGEAEEGEREKKEEEMEEGDVGEAEDEEEMAERNAGEAEDEEKEGEMVEGDVGEAEEGVEDAGETEEHVKEEEMTGQDIGEPEESEENSEELEKSPEKEEEIVEKSEKHVKEEENGGEDSNCSAGTEQGEVTGNSDINVKIEVKKEVDEGEGKTDDKLEVKTEKSIQENEESVKPNNETEETDTENENHEMTEETEDSVKEKAIEENGENESTNEDNETKEESYESDQDEAGPSTSKRKDYTDTGNSSDVEVIDIKKPKFTSDEELVKNFLKHSPSSISITPPKKSQYSKPPSAEALQALATLRQLKNISTTRVRRRRNENGDVIVIRDPPQRERNNFVNNAPTSTPRVRYQIPQNRNRGGLPVISSVQSINRNMQSNSLTPKIVTVQGNVSNFYNRSNNIGFPYRMNNTNNFSNMIPGFNRFPQLNNQFNNFSMFNNRQPQSSLKISNVRGNISFGPQPQLQRRFVTPTTSFRQTAPSSSTVPKDKDKKPVEYVVLD